MPDPATTKPGPDPKAAPTGGPPGAVIEGPPEEEFWEKYNSRLEFPLASVGTVLLHVAIGALLVFILLRLANKEDRSGVPVKLMEVAGLDDGDGSAGSGGEPDPFLKADGDPVRAAVDSLPDPSKLPEVRENIRQTIKYFDESGKLPISDANAAAYASLDESVRNKLLGARQGAGNEQGSGFDGSKGKGPGGTGADSTLGRNLRWVLRFKVSSGQDYIAQLRAMNAKVFVPIPGTKSGYLIEDLGAPDKHRMATEDDLARFGRMIKFHDSRRDVVNSVVQTLGLERGPTSFWAFFPKEIEDELARKETGFRNRRPEDIEETIFRVIIRGGVPDIVVDEQRAKR